MSEKTALYKRLLTHYSQKLNTIISRFKEAKIETIPEGEDFSEAEWEKEIQQALGAIEVCTSKIEQLWHDYANVLDGLESVPEREAEDFTSHIASAEQALATALDYTVILQGCLRLVTSAGKNNNTNPLVDVDLPKNTVEVRPMTLPTIPIPTFTGNIWDWDNFWTLFNTNVHTQPIPKLYKFNHLLNALKGEPFNAIKKFRVSEENYDEAVKFLRSKYENNEDLIHRLIVRLENAAARSPSLKDQRVLLDQLQVIVSQLRDKGELVDGQWLQKQILVKFPERFQRRVLEKKYSMEEAFRMDTLLSTLDQIISSEEKIALFTSKTSPGSQQWSTKKGRTFGEGVQRNNSACMYCGGDHKAAACTKYGTPQERSKYLREHKLCLICASPQHLTSECKKLCFSCQGRHHTSCCFKPNPTPVSSSATQKKSPVVTKTKEGEKSFPRQASTPAATHQLVHKGKPIPPTKELQEPKVNQFDSSKKNLAKQEAFLPIGELTVMDGETRKLKKVTVLMDSGAECSFIDTTLAEELHLPTIGTTTLRVRTFGSDDVIESASRKVPLDIWDENGDPHRLELFTHDILTSELKTAPVLPEDIEFLRSLKSPLNLAKEQKMTKPLVLLGCDQIWQLIRQDQTHIRLPSGLHLLPTRIGHLLTGRLHNACQVTPLLKKDDSLREWDECWSLESKVTMFSVENSSDSHNEQQLWEQYWTMEKDGTEEFTSTEKEVQSTIDKAVWQNFLDTVERRPDGYYVRLPWKELDVPLPDNRAIAMKRLISVWNSLQKDEKLLENYNGIFQEQERLGIIEQVDEHELVDGKIHYLPHQAVLSPQKATTKLRIVFDASAHYKNSPSLNDALYRGPVILPKLYGLLLRFRIGRIALISDVEKAFLQVRLHLVDRDATRCLWLRNYRSPPTNDNLVVYRFTRVTFGLLPSPFLLAATTQFHLDHYPTDNDIVQQVKANLYVDNLLLTTDTLVEATRAYTTTKRIFDDLHMNLRAFASNSSEVMETIEVADRSSDEDPKVLGIQWMVHGDQLEINCKAPECEQVTKRTVASSLASIYDPMGWVLPLLHRAKIFLQSLWKDGLEWDTPLPETRRTEWLSILNNIQGFRKMIPRCLTNKTSHVQVITCADASMEACAACTYMCTENSASLIMAKGKLQSLKSKMTIPKMELNALTLAMRLTNSVITQISSVVSIDAVLILTDSEIALNWVKRETKQDSGTFITNRVEEIHRILELWQQNQYSVQLGHISSLQNPADCATRGRDKFHLNDHYWWTGPAFLSEPKEEWKKAYKLVDVSKSTEEHDNKDGLKISSFGDTLSKAAEKTTALFQVIRGVKTSTVKKVVVHTPIVKTFGKVRKKHQRPLVDDQRHSASRNIPHQERRVRNELGYAKEEIRLVDEKLASRRNGTKHPMAAAE